MFFKKKKKLGLGLGLEKKNSKKRRSQLNPQGTLNSQKLAA